MLKSLEFIDDEYVLLSNPDGFKEDSYFLRKDYRRQFKTVYRTHAHFNSNLGFGEWALSFIAPLKFAYRKRKNEYDIFCDAGTIKKGFAGFYKNIFGLTDELRAEGTQPSAIDI
ncbi:MAG: hypothetical protein V2A66_08920 [Pseudomonadota bacterium]